MKGIVGMICKNERGFYTFIDGQFALIDRRSHSLLQEGEKWEFRILKEIRDRRGNSVPILYPVKRVEEVVFVEEDDEIFVVVRSGNRELERMTIKEALERGLVRVLSEELEKRPFLKGSREVKYETITGDRKWFWDTIPLSPEEKELIEREKEEWLKLLPPAPSLAKKREQKKKLKLRLREEIEELERKKEELSEAPRLELSYDWGAFKKYYEFSLSPNGEVEVVEVVYNSTPQLHFPSGRWEDNDGYEYVAVKWDDVPFDREEIKKQLLSLKKKREKELKKVEDRLSTLKRRLKRVESVELDKSKLHLHDLRELALDEDFWGLWVIPEFPRRVVEDGEFWEMVEGLPVKTPQGLLLGIVYVGAVPRSLYEKIVSDDVADVVVDYLEWFSKLT